MNEVIQMSLVRCDGSQDGPSEMVQIAVDRSVIDERLISRTEEVLEPGRARGLHLAADQDAYGAVTYLQHITAGSFFVYVGNPDQLEEHVFGPGDWVGFNDNRGLGHASKVGPDGCTRMFHLLRGQLEQPQTTEFGFGDAGGKGSGVKNAKHPEGRSGF